MWRRWQFLLAAAPAAAVAAVPMPIVSVVFSHTAAVVGWAYTQRWWWHGASNMSLHLYRVTALMWRRWQFMLAAAPEAAVAAVPMPIVTVLFSHAAAAVGWACPQRWWWHVGASSLSLHLYRVTALMWRRWH